MIKAQRCLDSGANAVNTVAHVDALGGYRGFGYLTLKTCWDAFVNFKSILLTSSGKMLRCFVDHKCLLGLSND